MRYPIPPLLSLGFINSSRKISAVNVLLPPIDVTATAILSDEVYARIGAAILDGTLPAGYRLRDVDLAAQLGVSRTPVREALQRLERFGLVEVAVGRYTRVSEPSEKIRQETAEFAIYVMGAALRLALQRCDDAQLESMIIAMDSLIDSSRRQDARGLFEASFSFFEGVTLATRNSVVIGSIQEASFAIRRNLSGWTPFLVGPITRGEAYVQLRDYIAVRDADGAEQTLRYLHGVA